MKKAQSRNLTLADFNEYVLVMNDKKQIQDKEIKTIKEKTARNEKDLTKIEEEYPLLPPEADDLSNAVKRKGVEVLGGKRSNAYKNKDLRTRTYRDIYSEIKRQYGLVDEVGRQLSYKKLRRKYLKGAFAVVDSYVAPISIQNDIDSENDLDLED